MISQFSSSKLLCLVKIEIYRLFKISLRKDKTQRQSKQSKINNQFSKIQSMVQIKFRNIQLMTN
jgi:hypothetical protein